MLTDTLLGAGGAAIVALVMLLRSLNGRSTTPLGPVLRGAAAPIALLRGSAPLGFD